MTEKKASSVKVKLPNKDWVMVPLIAVGTALVVALASESVAADFYSRSGESMQSCLDYSHKKTGIQGIPNCVTTGKDFETPVVQYKFDACGFRSDIPCGHFSPGTYRIVMIGSSIAFGGGAQQQDTMAYQIPKDIQQQTNRRVELHNESMMQEFPQFAEIRLRQALKNPPDMILWIVSAYDASVATESPDVMFEVNAGAKTKTRIAWWEDYLKQLFKNNSLLSIAETMNNHLVTRFQNTAAGVALQHYVDRGSERYVKAYLNRPDSESGYLKPSPSPAWKANYAAFDRYISEMAKLSRDANVKLVITLVPTRAQAAMLSAGVWPEGYDPYELDHSVRSMATLHGVQFIDIFPGLTHVPDMQNNYYLNGHPDNQGHVILARLIAAQLAPEILSASDHVVRIAEPSPSGK